MKQALLITSFLCVIGFLLVTHYNNSSNLVTTCKSPVTGKKTILVMTSRGGGGHISASQALSSYLQENYTIYNKIILEEVVSFLDPIQVITFKKYTADDLYNYLLKNRWIQLINISSSICRASIRWSHKRIKKAIIDYLQKNKPDLVISVVPLFNAALLDACKELLIPFLVVTVDLDTVQYINGLYIPDYKHFKYTLAFDDAGMYDKIAQAQIDKKYITIAGFPVRHEFLTPKDKNALKKEFALPEDTPIIMVLMGATGSINTYNYLHFISQLKYPVHIIICLGRNVSLRKKLEKIVLPKHITTTIVGFTDRIADYMAIADILITKPGPTTMCEALYMHVPMILDNTGSNVFWEEYNSIFIKKHKLGHVLTDYNNLENLITHCLNNKKNMQQALSNFKKELPNKIIKQLVAELLNT